MHESITEDFKNHKGSVVHYLISTGTEKVRTHAHTKFEDATM